ncbi:MAG: GyrI-like domain-containing protein [Paracoccaceae bacterium]
MSRSYEDRLRRVVRYIHDNPAGDLSLDRLAEVAAMSRFHWHRVYHAMTGETCADTVRRIRLHRASHWLVHTDDPVDVVAARAGYDNVKSFARAFRDSYGVTPLAFRKDGLPGTAPLLLKQGETGMYDVEIKSLPDQRLAGIEHKGAYPQIGAAYEQLSAVFTSRNLWPHARGMVAVYYCDPSAVPEADLRSLAGVSVTDALDIPDDLQESTLPGGRHAVLRLKGPYTGLPSAYEYLYGAWLSETGEEPADAPSFEMYLNSPMDTAPAELLTDVCVPLK